MQLKLQRNPPNQSSYVYLCVNFILINFKIQFQDIEMADYLDQVLSV